MPYATWLSYEERQELLMFVASAGFFMVMQCDEEDRNRNRKRKRDETEAMMTLCSSLLTLVRLATPFRHLVMPTVRIDF